MAVAARASKSRVITMAKRFPDLRRYAAAMPMTSVESTLVVVCEFAMSWMNFVGLSIMSSFVGDCAGLKVHCLLLQECTVLAQ